MTEPFDGLRDRLTRIEKAFQELRIGFAHLSNEVQSLHDDCASCPGSNVPDDFASDNFAKTPQRRRCEQPRPTLDDISKPHPVHLAHYPHDTSPLPVFDQRHKKGDFEP